MQSQTHSRNAFRALIRFAHRHTTSTQRMSTHCPQNVREMIYSTDIEITARIYQLTVVARSHNVNTQRTTQLLAANCSRTVRDVRFECAPSVFRRRTRIDYCEQFVVRSANEQSTALEMSVGYYERANVNGPKVARPTENLYQSHIRRTF